MCAASRYGKVLLKLSGNAFAGVNGAGFDQRQLRYIAGEIAAAARAGCALAVVPGAGNIIRGSGFGGGNGASRMQADNAGMVATMVNGLALCQKLEECGLTTHICSALPITNVVGGFDPDRCQEELDRGGVVVLAGGTGHPFFTTDTAAALRAVQLGMEVVLKATRVDGVYSADPETDGSSEFFASLTYEDILNRKLAIMDYSAIALCRDHGMPVRVFNFGEEGNLQRAISGDSVGTFIGHDKNGS